jgi:hypothetical protein
MAHARPFSTSTLKYLSNDIKNTSRQGVLTIAIKLWVFRSPGGLQIPIFLGVQVSSSHLPQSGVATNKVWVALWKKAIEIHESWKLETLRLGDPIMDPCLCVKRLIFRFHTLDYWPKLFIHHLLDPMYIVKNVCKSLLCHILGEKDTEESKVNFGCI